MPSDYDTVSSPVPTTTIRTTCPDGTVRVIFCADGFIKVLAGKSGTAGAATADALGRAITYILSLGGSLKDVADLIRGISHSESNRLIHMAVSVPDAVAICIDEYLTLEESDPTCQ